MGVTIYDVSEKAAVSIATVSRVLNGNQNVSEKTRQKVLDVIETFGYTPNAFARGLGLNTMNTIGILCADSSDMYLAKAVYYLEQFLRDSNYDTILCCTGYELERKQTCMNLLLSKHVDGVILCGSNFLEEDEADNRYIQDASSQVPIMLLNADYDSPNVYSTFCDDYRSMSVAVEAMAKSGHKNILYLYNSNSFSGKRKKDGFISGLQNTGIPVQKEYLRFYSGSHEDLEGMTSFIEKIATEIKFNAIIASEDSLALAAVKYARRAKRIIPKDLSIIGYNNSLLSLCCDPELSSVDNQLDILCKTLVRTLISVLSGENVPKKSIFYGEIIERDTTTFK